MKRGNRLHDAIGRRLRALAALTVGALILIGSSTPATAQGSAVEAAPWERITLVVRPDPEGRGMAVLFLARWRGTTAGEGGEVGGAGGDADGSPGSRQSAGPSAPAAALGPRPLPAVAGGRPAEPLPEGLRWEEGRLVDPAPAGRDGARDYAYVFLVDTRRTADHLEVVLPAPVERLVVLTVADQLQVRGEGMRPAGTVAGESVGLPGMDLAAFAAGPLPAGGYRLTLASPAMTAPGAGEAAVPRPTRRSGWEIGPWVLGIGAALLAAGGAAAVRWGRSPVRWERRRRALIQAIVELDRAHAQGEIPPDVYEAERRRLVTAAVVATRRWWAASGRVAADGAAGRGAGRRTSPSSSAPRSEGDRPPAAAAGAGGEGAAAGASAAFRRQGEQRGVTRGVTPR
ncbi:MAG TPA: hypothetical protein VIL40_04715 [Thermaerobacter sp.]